MFDFINYDSLTDQQKVDIKSLMSGHKEDMEKLQEKYKIEMMTLHKSHLESLRQYVPSDKLEDFNKFISEL
jgi:hypothetical protein